MVWHTKLNKLLKPLLFIIFTLVIVGGSHSAKAENAKVNCHGCSFVQERNAARNAVSTGFVWVFNGPDNNVRKFEILDETIGDQGLPQMAAQRTVEPILKTKFQQYVSA